LTGWPIIISGTGINEDTFIPGGGYAVYNVMSSAMNGSLELPTGVRGALDFRANTQRCGNGVLKMPRRSKLRLNEEKKKI